MRKTSLMIDDETIARVGDALGTSGIKETIDAALEEVLASRMAARHFERLHTMEGLDLDDPDVMREAWR
jgi:Arc/MetJ family transcription regulator